MTASTDLDDTLANIRARAEAATDSQWEQEWWRCHAEDYFRAAMGGVSDLVGYFTTLTPSAVLDLLNRLDHVTTQRDEIQANRDALAHKIAEQRAIIARVQMLLDDAETAGDATVEIADLDAALDGADTTTAESAECDQPGIEHGPFWATGICPKCRRCKFIGHGPLCADCLTAATTTDGDAVPEGDTHA